MRNRAVRGSRLSGPTAGEIDRGAPLAARHEASYWCHAGHLTTAAFSQEVHPPALWECTCCGAPASTRPDSLAPPQPRTGFHRTPYEFLMMRRTEEDGERLLAEALAQLRNHKPGR